MVIFGFFGETCLKLELSTFVVHKTLIEHKEKTHQVNFRGENTL